MKQLLVAVAVGLMAAATAGAAGAADAPSNSSSLVPACEPRFDMYAPNATDAPCGPEGKCNFPAGWTRPSQAQAGGNDVSPGAVFKIAIDQYGGQNPTLWWQLRHPLLVKAGEPMAECAPPPSVDTEAEEEAAAVADEEATAAAAAAATEQEDAAKAASAAAEETAAVATEEPAKEEAEPAPRLSLDPKAAEEAQALAEAAAAAAAEADSEANAQAAAEEEAAAEAEAALEAEAAAGPAEGDLPDVAEVTPPPQQPTQPTQPPSTRRRLLGPSAPAQAAPPAPTKPAAAPVAAAAALAPKATTTSTTGKNATTTTTTPAPPVVAAAMLAPPATPTHPPPAALAKRTAAGGDAPIDPPVTVQQPPTYTAQYSLDGAPWMPVANADGQTTFSSDAPGEQKPPMVGIPANLNDGEHCLRLKATLVANSGRLSTGDPVPAQDHVADTVVCFFRSARQANATFSYDMCGGLEGLVVNVTDISPPAVPLTLNGTALSPSVMSAADGGPALLLQPLIKVWGTKVRNIDGSPADGGFDQAAKTGVNYFIKYAAVGLPAAEGGSNGTAADAADADAAAASGGGNNGTSITVALDPEGATSAGGRLEEGYYRMSAVVSLLTEVPSLVDLNGLTQIKQQDQAGIASGVTGKWETKSNMALDGALVGVQRSPTYLSAVKSASHGPRDAVSAGQEVVLTWDFRGVGSARCEHDGAPLSNTADGEHCKSPLAFPAAADVGKKGGGGDHGVVVVFTDVCGGNKTAEFSYTSKGVVAVSKVDDPSVTGVWPRGSGDGLEGAAGGGVLGDGMRLKSGAALASSALATPALALLAAALVL